VLLGAPFVCDPLDSFAMAFSWWCMLAVSLACCLVLSGLGQAAEVCLRGDIDVAAVVMPDPAISLEHLIVFFCIGIATGITCGWKAHSWRSVAWPGASETIGSSRNVATQSQVRYGWGRSDPRFVPLPDRDHGAWLDYEPPLSTVT